MPPSTKRTVFERMVAIVAALPAIGKNQENTQQSFMFRGFDDILNALNPLLAEHGVFMVPHVLERVPAQRVTARGAVMFEVNLHVQFTFYGQDGDYIQGSTWGEGTDMGDKATSKAMTMAFKSMLNQAFAISNQEVSDADGQTPEESIRQPQPDPTPAEPQDPPAAAGMISEAQRRRLFAIAQESAVDHERLKQIVMQITGQDSTTAIPKEKYDELCNAVKAEEVPF